jgi:hypothetical protein
VPEAGERLLDVLLEKEPRVVGADRYSHGEQLYSTLSAFPLSGIRAGRRC